MVRTPDPFWTHVVEMNDGCKKCEFCEHIYTRGTSVSRVKYHLSGLRRAGVKICQMVPEDVRDAARAAIDGPPEKKHKTTASSSNNKADNIIIPASLPEQNSEAENGMADHSPGTLEWFQMLIGEIELHDEGTHPEVLMVDPAENTLITKQVGQDYETTYNISSLFAEDNVESNNQENASTGLMQQVEGSGFLEGFTVDEAEHPDNVVSNNLENATMGLMQQVEGSGFLERFTIDEAERPMHLEVMDSQVLTTLQPTDLECQVVERDCSQIYSSSVIDDVLMNDEGNMAREPGQTGVRDGLQHIADQTGGEAFPTPKLVGGGFEKYKNAIWSWLMKDEVSLIGIYGMGGVGKTKLVQHIHNQLLDAPNNYHEVYWVTASQDFSIHKLQNLIAKRIGLDLSNEDDEMHRAAKMSKALAAKQKYVLILDDLWDHFVVEKVGIPSEMNGCKLILTTRSLDICRRMGCEGNVIKVEPLSSKEAWKLFEMELGNYDIKLEPLAKAVASECDGLPLGIITMARSMRGVYDEHEWRSALDELKESRVRQSDMEPEVFRILKFSYLRLKDSTLQQCFLYCALFPEDFIIKRDDLIEFLIDERIIERRKSRLAEFDKGHEMVNRLENVCLLESVTAFGGHGAVKMHDLVRDMALQEMRENSRVMVEAGEHLTELPDEEKWTEDLRRVSLMQNEIKEIPSSHSPSCPNLSTLLLCRNLKLKFIGDSFFKQFLRLEVLDLSNTAIGKLPDPISDLVTLTTLSLGNCVHLTHVPSLAKLKALRKLDLYATALREVPLGLELLCNLRYLDLGGTLIQEFPVGILPNLFHLQFLRLRFMVKIEADELAFLRKLETLECHFSNLLDFNKYLKSQEEFHVLSALDSDKQRGLLRAYDFLIGDIFLIDGKGIVARKRLSRSVYLCGAEIYGDALVLPKGIQELRIEACPDMRCLCDFYPLENATELKFLSIGECDSMECLVSFSQVSLRLLGTVVALHLDFLDKFHSFCSKDLAASAPLPCNDIFSHLIELKIIGCNRLEVLFPSGLLPNLRNLQLFHVQNCDSLEKLIATEKSNICSGNNLEIEFCLPKLRILKLTNLLKLRSIGCGKLICNSLQEIRIYGCKSLESLPFSCSRLTLKTILAIPKEWWESLKWDEKNHGYSVRHSLEPRDYVALSDYESLWIMHEARVTREALRRNLLELSLKHGDLISSDLLHKSNEKRRRRFLNSDMRIFFGSGCPFNEDSE